MRAFSCPEPNTMSGPRPTLHLRPGAPSADEVRRLLSYEPDTGIFRHKRPSRGPLVQGAIAGTLDNYGYRKIGVNGTQYRAHHLAWLHHFGAWANDEIDHVNGNPDDNRISNLRPCQHAQNQRNRGPQRNNKLGLKGVEALPYGAFRARLHVGGRTIHLGCFKTAAEASAEFQRAERERFGEFSRQEQAA